MNKLSSNPYVYKEDMYGWNRIQFRIYLKSVNSMVCPSYDEANSKCLETGQKFYQGMQKPCDDISDSSKCPILLMRGWDDFFFKSFLPSLLIFWVFL